MKDSEYRIMVQMHMLDRATHKEFEKLQMQYVNDRTVATHGWMIGYLYDHRDEEIYQKALEPLIIAISQAFTKKLFTPREKSFGNEIKFYPKDLIFMTTTQKIELVNLLSPTGALFENEKRSMFGLMPLPELEDKRYMSLNWVDASLAADYQMGQIGNVNMEVIDENKNETITEE